MKHPKVGELYQVVSHPRDSGRTVNAYKMIDSDDDEDAGLFEEHTIVPNDVWVLCVDLLDYGWVSVLYEDCLLEIHQMCLDLIE